MPWGSYLAIGGWAMIKFLFSATIAFNTTDLTSFEIFVTTSIGALIAFNIFFWLSEWILEYSKRKKLKAIKKGKRKRKKAFTKKNKIIVRIKHSNYGLILLSTAGVLFLSIPLSAIILAKFYGDRMVAYFIAVSFIVLAAFSLTYLNEFIFT